MSSSSSSSSSSTASGGVKGAMLMLVNSMVARIAVLGLGVAIGLQSISSAASIKAVVHVFAFAFWFGMSLYTTFVLGIVLYRNLPRQTFGLVQSKLFPRYFESSCMLIAVSAATMPSSLRSSSTFTALGLALFASLSNLVLIEPITSRTMFERHALESKMGISTIEESKKAAATSDELSTLNKRFGMLHGISSLANLIAIGAAAYHACIIASCITPLSSA